MLEVRWQKYLSYCSVTSVHLVSMVLWDGEAKRQAVQLSVSSACLPVWRQGRQRLSSNISAARPAASPLMLLCAGTAEEKNNEKPPAKLQRPCSSLAKAAEVSLQFILQIVHKKSQILENFLCFSPLFVDWLEDGEQRGFLCFFSLLNKHIVCTLPHHTLRPQTLFLSSPLSQGPEQYFRSSWSRDWS